MFSLSNASNTKMTFPSSFITQNIKLGAKEFEIRCNLYTETDANKWLSEYSEISKSNWIIKDGLYKPQRLIYHKIFACQHARKNKTRSDSNRNTDCLAKIDIKIKKVNKGTRKNDPYLQTAIPLPAIIKGNIAHNHSMNTSGSLKYLRMTQQTKEKFVSLFEDGLGVGESIKQFENKVIANNLNVAETTANSSISPTYNMVKNIFKKWRADNFGHVTDAIEKLAEKNDYYVAQGVAIHIHTDTPWAILLQTPIMKRTQQLTEASEIIFIDSTCSVDAVNSTLTVILTSSKAGALPLCFLVHQGQTEESYSNAFNLLKLNSPLAFGGKNCPIAFMTDNCTAEKNALKLLWSNARQLLCHLHVAQAEWRWLLSSKNKIIDRSEIMKLFPKVLYSNSENNFEESVKSIMESANIPHNFKKRLEDFLKQAEEWVLFYRQGLITRGHNTNNYSEATMRIIKDIILQRTKAFNAVALVDYCTTVWEKYITVRILNFANGKKDSSFLKLNKLEKASRNYDISKIIKIDDFIFSVPSFTSDANIYEVNTSVGYCSCLSGLQGAFYKHQYIIHKHHKELLPNVPLLNTVDRYLLAKLALGQECPDPEFYEDLKSNDTSVSNVIIAGEPISQNEASADISDTISREVQVLSKTLNEEEMLTNVENFNKEMLGFSSKLPPTELVNKHLILINKQLSKISTDQDAVDALIRFSTCLRKKKGGIIKVQPTSIARRNARTSRGCKRIASGRPALTHVAKRAKRKHNLQSNIQNDRANAIIHGRSH